MKGLILAGGSGSRLSPLTTVTNKHLLPVGHCPMIYYPIFKLKTAGIEEIMIVTGVDHMGDIVSLLGSGSRFGVHFTYRVQDEAGGIAQAIGLAQSFVGNDKFVTILGDNIFQDPLGPYLESFQTPKVKAKVILKEIPDANRFGVATIKGNKIVKVVEKPKNPETNLAITGIYMFDPYTFKVIPTLKRSLRNELEITEIIQAYIDKDELTYDIANGWWTDAGTFDSLNTANQLVRKSGLFQQVTEAFD